MPDPLLTSLCAVCRASPRRYRCPRCGAQYCSLACNRRHKEWAGCSGVRDVTAYVPRARLCTPAGVDHDYNFLSAVERSRERAEKLIVEEKGLLREGELRPPENRFRKEWRGDELRFVLLEPTMAAGRGRGGGRGGADKTDRAEKEGRELLRMQQKAARAARAAGIEVISAPQGLSRQRENATTERHRHRGQLNWQVEWLVYEEGTEGAEGTAGTAATAAASGVEGRQQRKQQTKKPTRVLRKHFDHVPLYRAFASTMEWLATTTTTTTADGEMGEENDDDEPRHPRKKRRKHPLIAEADLPPFAQDANSTIWAYDTPYPVQNPFTGAWDVERAGGATATTWARDADAEEKRHFQYFLLHVARPGEPRMPVSGKQLIPVSATECLADVLRGRAVLEFPTVYVLPPGAALPAGHVLGSTERRGLGFRQQPKDASDDEEEEEEDNNKLQKEGRGTKRKKPLPTSPNKAKRGLPQSKMTAQPAKKRRAAAVVARAAVMDMGGASMPMPMDLDEGEILDDDETSSEGSTTTTTTSSDEDTSDEEVAEAVDAKGDEEDGSEDDIMHALEHELGLEEGEVDGEGQGEGGQTELEALLTGGANKRLVVYDSWSEDEGGGEGRGQRRWR